MSEPATTARYPYAVPVDAYGNGGFRFAEMSHKGSLLFLPTGVFAWSPPAVDRLTAADFDRVLAAADKLEFLLLGTGDSQIFPSFELRALFEERGIGLEPMSTGAAARTYNVLLAEKRAVGAALMAVD